MIGLTVILLGIVIVDVAVTAHYYRDMRAVREHIEGLGSRVDQLSQGIASIVAVVLLALFARSLRGLDHAAPESRQDPSSIKLNARR